WRDLRERAKKRQHGWLEPCCRSCRASGRGDHFSCAGVAPPPPPPALAAGGVWGMAPPPGFLTVGPPPADDELLPQPVRTTVSAKPDSRQMMRRVIVVKSSSCMRWCPKTTSIDPLRDQAVFPAAQGPEDLELRARVEVLRVAQAADRAVAVG